MILDLISMKMVDVTFESGSNKALSNRLQWEASNSKRDWSIARGPAAAFQ